MKIEKFRPWSFKKRVLVAIVSGLLILIFALLLGSSMYYLGIRNQIFATQSLKRLLYTQLIEDEELERVLGKISLLDTCINNHLRLVVTYSAGVLALRESHDTQACLAFDWVRNAQTLEPAVSIRPLYGSKKDILDPVSLSISDLVVDGFDHPLYSSILLSGIYRSIPVRIYLVEGPDNIVWEVKYGPVNEREINNIDELVRSIELL